MPEIKIYRMEIFELREGSVGPVLRERRDVYAPDDMTAVAKANARYRELAPGLNLTNFSLYDPSGGLVYEPVREDLLIPRGSRKRPAD